MAKFQVTLVSFSGASEAKTIEVEADDFEIGASFVSFIRKDWSIKDDAPGVETVATFQVDCVLSIIKSEG